MDVDGKHLKILDGHDALEYLSYEPTLDEATCLYLNLLKQNSRLDIGLCMK